MESFGLEIARAIIPSPLAILGSWVSAKSSTWCVPFSTALLCQNIAFLLWLATKGRLMTLDRLNKWTTGYVDGVCSLCGDEEESHKNLFFQCGYSR